MIALCCALALVLSLTVERPYMKVGRDVLARFQRTGSTDVSLHPCKIRH
jgi:hypothetical protein